MSDFTVAPDKLDALADLVALACDGHEIGWDVSALLSEREPTPTKDIASAILGLVFGEAGL